MMYIIVWLALFALLLLMAWRVRVVLKHRAARHDEQEKLAVAEREAKYLAIGAQLRAKFDAIAESGDEVVAAFEAELQQALEEANTIAKAVDREFKPLGAWKTWASMNEAVQDAKHDIRRRNEQRDYATCALEALQDYSNLPNRGKAISTALSHLRGPYSFLLSELEVDVDKLRRDVQDHLLAWFLPLWENRFKKEAFAELFMFFKESSEHYNKSYAPKSKYRVYVEAGITLPIAGWNDAVALHMKNPSIWDFWTPESPKKGELLHRAAEALLHRSFTDAKIILAYCKYHEAYRGMVGMLREQLAMMLAEMEANEMAPKLLYVSA